MFSQISVPLLDFLSHSAAPKTMKFASHSFVCWFVCLAEFIAWRKVRTLITGSYFYCCYKGAVQCGT